MSAELIILMMALSISALSLLGTGSSSSPATREANRTFRRWDKSAYVVTLVGLVLSAITGFAGYNSAGRLEGWLLLLHTPGTVLFVIGLMLLALGLAERCRFGTIGATTDEGRLKGIAAGQKVVFWTLLLLGLLSIVSVLAAMLPVFGYDVQEKLIILHLLSGIGLVIVAVAHFVLLASSGLRR